MYTIYIDTTDKYTKKIKIVDQENKLVEEISGNLDVVSSLKDTLAKHKIKVEDVIRIIPNTGPGSFTGLKMGVTIANVINWANKRASIQDLYFPEYGREPNITLKEF